MSRTTCGLRRLFWFAWTVALVGGCVSLKPDADYRKAGEMAQQRTGSADIYDPTNDAIVQDRLAALLADGLTVDEAVAAALLNNREFQAAFYSIGVSRADLAQSSLLTNPVASFMLRFPEGGGRAKMEVGFAQELADLWQLPIRKKIAQAELDATVFDIARQGVTLAADVRFTAYRLLTLRQTEVTVRENLQLVQQSEQLALRRFEAGEASQLDVNLARTEMLNVRLELLQLNREIRLAEARLARLLNLDQPDGGSVLHDKLPEPGVVADEAALLAMASVQRLDLQAAESRVQAANRQIRQAWLKVFPSLSAGVDVERMERRALPGRKILADTARESIANGALTAPPIQSRAERQREKRQEIDAVLGPAFQGTLPLWDQNQAQIARAAHLSEQQRKRYEDVLNQVANEVHQAVITLENAREIVEFYRTEALPQASLSLENALRLYQAGEQGIIVVIDAQTSLIGQRRAYANVLGDYATALAELERAVGGRVVPTPAATSTRPAPSTPTTNPEK